MKTIDQLITIYFDGTLSDEESRSLQDWLRSDPANIERFVYATYVHRSMYDILHGQNTQKLLRDNEKSEGICDNDFWEALLAAEKNTPGTKKEECENCGQSPIVPDRSNIQVSKGRFNRFAWVTATLSLAALFFLIAYVHVNPKQISEPAAVVMDVIQLEQPENSPYLRPGTRLFTRQGVIQLNKGYVKLKFDNGADMIIEGPSEFELVTYDEVALYTGRLYAQVPHRTVGFIVSTPNSKVIDLGTGFGVYADSRGNTDIHVLDGQVSIVSGTRSDVRNSEILTENQACRVEMGSEVIHPITFKREAFVQDIRSKTNFVWRGQPLDLADIVGGGNGLGSGKLGQCIDPQSGKLTPDIPLARVKRTVPYMTTPELNYIDGIFIPDGSNGPIQITSEGHLYACPVTMGECYYGIFNGSVLPLKTGDRGYIDHALQFRGTVFGTPERPALTLHSNLGITFDLDEIRKSLPAGGYIKTFTAECGIGEGPEGSTRVNDYSSFYVLIDGVEQFNAVDMDYQSDMKSINLEITENNRFLTLLTTDGKDKSLHLGWAFFADPRLHIELAQQ